MLATRLLGAPPAHPTTRAEALQVVDRMLLESLIAEVHSQRLARANWAAIGQAYGVSRQAARKRFGYLDGEGPVWLMGDGTWRVDQTRAAIGREQLDQVQRAGVIADHHPDVAMLRRLALDAAAAVALPAQREASS